MDAEMADPSAVGPDPTGLATLANPGPSNTKRRRMDSQEKLGTVNTSHYNLRSRPSSHEVTENISAVPEMVSRPCPVPNVALDDIYEQMKLGMESFSSWWKKKFPEGTCEEDIQRAFEMYRLCVTEADLVHLMAKHADHVPFTLSDDLEAKRTELIVALHNANINAYPHILDMEIVDLERMVSDSIKKLFETQSLVKMETVHDIELLEKALKPVNLKDRRDTMQQQAEQKVAEARAAVVNLSTEYLFWHTMSRFRPSHVLIGAGAPSPGTRDTPDELAFQIPRAVYLEKARLGSAEFEAWFKDHFKAAALPLVDSKAIKSLLKCVHLKLLKKKPKL